MPSERTSDVRARLGRRAAKIVRYDPSTIDYRHELSDAQAAIAVRTDALERVLRYLETASVTATLAFELELRSLNEDIEAYTGQIRRMRNDIRFARVDVALSSHEQTLPEGGWSSFSWINELGMYDFLEESRSHGRYR